jgi:hypothetical protein
MLQRAVIRILNVSRIGVDLMMTISTAKSNPFRGPYKRGDRALPASGKYRQKNDPLIKKSFILKK